jgi:hypothetical protein
MSDGSAEPSFSRIHAGHNPDRTQTEPGKPGTHSPLRTQAESHHRRGCRYLKPRRTVAQLADPIDDQLGLFDTPETVAPGMTAEGLSPDE